MRTAWEARRRRLPPRYLTDVWDLPFRRAVRDAIAPEASILDIGAGRRPAVPPEERPPGCTYVALDESRSELESALPGSFDEIVVASAEAYVPDLSRRFDLAVSWLAMEHVISLERTLENAHRYLAPGGVLLAQMSGAFSPFSLLNRLLPGAASRAILARTQGREPSTVFPATYDGCWSSNLSRLLATRWREWEVLPLFTGAGYTLFSGPLTSAYIAYEEWAYRHGHANLAPYYLVKATA